MTVLLNLDQSSYVFVMLAVLSSHSRYIYELCNTFNAYIDTAQGSSHDLHYLCNSTDVERKIFKVSLKRFTILALKNPVSRFS